MIRPGIYKATKYGSLYVQTLTYFKICNFCQKCWNVQNYLYRLYKFMSGLYQQKFNFLICFAL